MCRCFGQKEVLEIYNDNLGTGKIWVIDTCGERRKFSGPIRTSKVKCCLCGEVYLAPVTIPEKEIKIKKV